MKPLLERLLAILASLKVTVIGLLLLMILTIWGTLYQAEHGLYQAQERFYQSWFLWVWNLIPFPGAQTVMTVLFVNLGASVAYMALRRKLSVGFVTTHLGLALLLAAGGVTFYTGREAQLSLEEGESSNVAVSMRDWELAVVPAMPQPKRTVLALSASDLRPGRSIQMPDGKTTIRVEQFYDNSAAEKADVQNPPHSGSGATVLHRQPAAREPSDNYPGAILVLERGGQPVARFLVWGGDGVPVVLDLPEGSRAIGLRRERLPLPASIELVDFIRELHPGTGIARSYSSDVLVRTGAEMKRKVHVAMNKPLRLHDFTFYQSSFGNAPGGRETSTFSVVQNSSRVIPYVATGLTGAGMIVHFSGMLITRLRRNRREAVS